MHMQFTKAKVIQGMGTDKVMIETNLPNPCWPYSGLLYISFETARDNGPAYVKAYFKLEPEIVHRVER